MYGWKWKPQGEMSPADEVADILALDTYQAHTAAMALTVEMLAGEPKVVDEWREELERLLATLRAMVAEASGEWYRRGLGKGSRIPMHRDWEPLARDTMPLVHQLAEEARGFYDVEDDWARLSRLFAMLAYDAGAAIWRPLDHQPVNGIWDPGDYTEEPQAWRAHETVWRVWFGVMDSPGVLVHRARGGFIRTLEDQLELVDLYGGVPVQVFDGASDAVDEAVDWIEEQCEQTEDDELSLRWCHYLRTEDEVRALWDEAFVEAEGNEGQAHEIFSEAAGMAYGNHGRYLSEDEVSYLQLPDFWPPVQGGS